MNKRNPKFIITNNGIIYTFIQWYIFSIDGVHNSTWVGAQVKDLDGNNFGIPVSEIKTKIYENTPSQPVQRKRGKTTANKRGSLLR